MAEPLSLEQQQALALAAARLRLAQQPPIQANPATDYGGGTLQVGPWDTGIPTSQGVQNFLAGAGKATQDLVRGTEQTLHLGGPQLQQQIDESKRLDAPLMATGAGTAGNITGTMADLAPFAMLPGANTIPGAAATGAIQGALAPAATGQSRLENVALGGALGAGSLGAGRLIGRAIRPVGAALNPQAQRLADVAQSEGIPLRLSQLTGSKPLAVTESVLEQLPFSSGPQIAQKEAQQAAFNAAVLRKAGIEGTSATAPILSARKAALGATFNRLARGSALDFNQGLGDQLANIVGEANQHLPPADAGRVSGVVGKILSQVGPDGRMLGTNYQGWREPLRLMAKGADAPGHYMGQIRSALDSAFTQQLPAELAPQWSEASGQYGALKQILKAMGGPGAQTKLGDISPAQLEGALTQTVGKEGKALGRGSLNDLVAAGRQFVSPSVPDSGTAIRNYVTKALTGAALPAAAGAGAGYYYGGVPGMATGAALGAGLDLAQSAAIPYLAQKALSSPVARSYLTRGLIPITEAQRGMLAQALRQGGVGATAYLEGQ